MFFLSTALRFKAPIFTRHHLCAPFQGGSTAAREVHRLSLTEKSFGPAVGSYWAVRRGFHGEGGRGGWESEGDSVHCILMQSLSVNPVLKVTQRNHKTKTTTTTASTAEPCCRLCSHAGLPGFCTLSSVSIVLTRFHQDPPRLDCVFGFLRAFSGVICFPFLGFELAVWPVVASAAFPSRCSAFSLRADPIIDQLMAVDVSAGHQPPMQSIEQVEGSDADVGRHGDGAQRDADLAK